MNAPLTGDLVVHEKQLVATDTLQIKLHPEKLKTLTGTEVDTPFSYEPGQFVSIGFSAKAWRAYSIASLPTEDLLELTVRLVEGGVGSEAFRAAEIGEVFPFKGPFGHFGLSDTPGAHLVFCATGTGIAPFKSMIRAEAQTDNPRPMTLLYGGKNAADIAYLDELKAWSAALNIQLGLSRDPSLELPAGVTLPAKNCRITQLLPDLDFKEDLEFYLCGNGAMVKSVQELLESHEVPKERILMERFN